MSLLLPHLKTSVFDNYRRASCRYLVIFPTHSQKSEVLPHFLHIFPAPKHVSSNFLHEHLSTQRISCTNGGSSVTPTVVHIFLQFCDLVLRMYVKSKRMLSFCRANAVASRKKVKIAGECECHIFPFDNTSNEIIMNVEIGSREQIP